MAGINFKAFDLGGHEIARRVWKDYYAKVSSMVPAGDVTVLVHHENHQLSIRCSQLLVSASLEGDKYVEAEQSSIAHTHGALATVAVCTGGCTGVPGGRGGQGAVSGVQKGAGCAAGR